MTPLQITGLVLGYLFIGVIAAVMIYRDDQNNLDEPSFAKTESGYTVVIFIWPILLVLLIGALIYGAFSKLPNFGAKVIRFFDFILPPWRSKFKEVDYPPGYDIAAERERYEQVRDRLIERYEDDPNNFVDYDNYVDDLRAQLRVAYEEEDLNYENIRVQGEPVNYVNWPPYEHDGYAEDDDPEENPELDITPY